MKKFFSGLFFLMAINYCFAQEPADALRYSYLNNPGGTARNQAIGGAGASLGGEFSSLFINPAGLGFYKTGDFVLTPSFSFKKSNSTYLGSANTATDNNFNLGASGFVVGGASRNAGSVKSVAFGIGVNRTADFNNHIYYKGKNTSSSYSEKYLEELTDNNVTDPNNAANNYPYGSSLAFNTYLIDTLANPDGSLKGYRSLANPATGLIQENTVNTTGGITDLSVGGGLNVNDKWFFGATLSFPFLHYTRSALYKESDASGNPNNNFNYFTVSENLTTKGIGINGKFGVIYKPVEQARIGFAVYTPTLYDVTDDYTTTVTTDMEGYGGAGVKTQSSTDFSNGQPLESKYNLTTPLRLILSGSYLFGTDLENVKSQKGFITADLEYANYKKSAFSDNNNDADANDYYHSLNSTISNIYKNAFNARLGGEIKLNTFMVRLGGAYYGNPYVNESSDVVKMTGGIGIRNKGLFFDLAYVYTMVKDVNYPYLLEDKPNNPAFLKNNYGSVVATIGFKL